MELDAKFRPAIDPVDGMSDKTDSDEGGTHYGRIRQYRYPHGPTPRNRAAKQACHEDMQETGNLQQVYESNLIDELLRVSRRHPQKQLRLAKKDGLDKKAYETLLPLSREVERSQERFVVCFTSILWQYD